MRGVGYTVLLFFNYVYKISIEQQIIASNNKIYNIFGSVIYHKTRSIFKPKSQ